MWNSLRFAAGLLGLSLAYNGYAFASDTPDAYEAEIIELLHRNVERKGPDLFVHSNGPELKFSDVPNTGDGCWEQHHIVSYTPETDVLIIANEDCYEVNYDWIRLKGGVHVNIKGLPHYSPSGKRFLTIGGIDVGYYNIQVWTLIYGDAQLELQYGPVRYAQYTFAEWKNEDEVELTVETLINHIKTEKMPAKLIYGAPNFPGWHLEGPDETPN